MCVHWIISHRLDKFVKQKQEDSYLRKILILKIPLLLFREIKRFSFPCFRPADGRSGWGGSVSSTKRWTGKTRRGVRVNPPGRPRVPSGLRTRRRTSASGPPTTRSGTSGSTGEGRRCCTLLGRKKIRKKNSPTYLHFSTFSRKISDIEQDILNLVFILFVSRSGYPVTLPRAMSDPQNPAAHPVNPDRCDFLFSTGPWTEKSLREEWSGLFQHILHRQQQQQQQQQQQSLLESERDSIRRRNNSKHAIVPERRRGKKKKKVAPRRKSKGKQKNAMITKSSRKGSSMDGAEDSSVGWRRRRRRRKHRRQKQQQQQQRRRRQRRPRRQRSKSS